MTEKQYERFRKEEPQLNLRPLAMTNPHWRLSELPKLSRKKFIARRVAYLMGDHRPKLESGYWEGYTPEGNPF